jgi:hypothetical protein
VLRRILRFSHPLETKRLNEVVLAVESMEGGTAIYIPRPEVTQLRELESESSVGVDVGTFSVKFPMMAICGETLGKTLHPSASTSPSVIWGDQHWAPRFSNSRIR